MSPQARSHYCAMRTRDGQSAEQIARELTAWGPREVSPIEVRRILRDWHEAEASARMVRESVAVDIVRAFFQGAANVY